MKTILIYTVRIVEKLLFLKFYLGDRFVCGEAEQFWQVDFGGSGKRLAYVLLDGGQIGAT